MTCVEQRRLIMRMNFVKTTAALTVHAANTAKAWLDRMTQEVRKPVEFLEYIACEADSAGPSEAVPAGLLRELKWVLELTVTDAGVKMDVDRRLEDKNTPPECGVSETLLALAHIADPLRCLPAEGQRSN
jgi:hypothetical protein